MTSAVGNDDFDFENVKYRPEICPQTNLRVQADGIENFMTNNPLEQRAMLVYGAKNSNHSIHIIDTCIRVKIPSDTFRGEKVKHWEEKHSTAKKWAWIESGFATLSALGTVGAIAAQTIPLVAVAFGIASVASMIFCGINISRTSDASRQIEGWKASPLEKLANERAKAYEQGFPYVYRKDLKLQGMSNHQILLPSEVQFLFERHFDSFCMKLLSQRLSTEQEKKEWLDSFTNCNPVANNLLCYAYEGMVPEKYGQVSFDYEVLHRQLNDMRGEFTKLRNQRHAETNTIIQEINSNRKFALLPFQGMFTYWTLQAQTDRDQKLEKTTDPKKREEINQEHSAAVRKYELYYAAATTPVHLVFDNQISNAKETLQSILKEIRKNEASSHAPYFNYAWGLLDYARKVKQEPTYVYQPQVLTPEQVFNIPAPSAPPVININFIQQAQSERPQGIDESNYTDYLRFVSVKQETQKPLYLNLRSS